MRTFAPRSLLLTGTSLEMGDLFSGRWRVNSSIFTAQSWSRILVFSTKEPKCYERKTGQQKQNPSAQGGPIMYIWAVTSVMVTETEVEEEENLFSLIKLEFRLSIHVSGYTFHAVLGTF